MGHSSRVKLFAYAVDPACWLSYSGKPPEVKRALDARRNSALKYATENLWRVPPGVKFPSPFWRDIVTEPLKWTPWKMKIMLHMAATPQFPYLATVVKPRSPDGARAQERSFRRCCQELVNEGLIAPCNPNEGVYTATKKGRVFVEAVLTTPLPVPVEPVWKMPC